MPIKGAILLVFVRGSISRRVLVSAVTVNNPCIDKPNHGRGAKVTKLLPDFSLPPAVFRNLLLKNLELDFMVMFV